MQSKLSDVRSWLYFPIIMPLREDGTGPASDDEMTSITWEVWDQFCSSYGSFEYQADAINKAIELNGFQEQVVEPPKEWTENA
jgi:hypothetical protein